MFIVAPRREGVSRLTIDTWARLIEILECAFISIKRPAVIDWIGLNESCWAGVSFPAVVGHRPEQFHLVDEYYDLLGSGPVVRG